MYSFPYLEPVCSSMSSSNCWFLTCIQISQEASQVAWYSHLFQNFPQFAVMHTVKGFDIVIKAEIDVFFGTHYRLILGTNPIFPCFYSRPLCLSNLEDFINYLCIAVTVSVAFSPVCLLTPLFGHFPHATTTHANDP